MLSMRVDIDVYIRRRTKRGQVEQNMVRTPFNSRVISVRGEREKEHLSVSSANTDTQSDRQVANELILAKQEGSTVDKCTFRH